LNSVPSQLDLKTVFSIIKEDSLVFEVFLGIFNGVLEVDDRVFKEGLSLGQSLVLFLEVSTLDFPVLGLFLFSGEEGSSAGDQLLSDLGQ
jgi:hypothetical protein